MKKLVTIITPVLNEEAGLPLYAEAIKRVLFSLEQYDFKVLLVDDGSTDSSWLLIRELSASDPRFGGLRLSRNMGAHIAASAGLEAAEGDAVIVMACDLQDPPEAAREFLAAWEKGARIVWGHRKTRKDSFRKILFSRIFNKLISKIAMPKNSKFTTGGFLLADRKVVEAFRQFRERNRIVFALVAWTGFEQDIVYYERRERVAGQSGWTFGRMIKSAYDVIIGYSSVPIRLITFIGVGCFLLTIPVATFLIYQKLTGSPMLGWTGILLAVIVFFGVQFLLTGIMGEYLFRIHAEVLGRPLYFVSEESGRETGIRLARTTNSA